jgi:hypothetical protein
MADNDNLSSDEDLADQAGQAIYDQIKAHPDPESPNGVKAEVYVRAYWWVPGEAHDPDEYMLLIQDSDLMKPGVRIVGELDSLKPTSLFMEVCDPRPNAYLPEFWENPWREYAPVSGSERVLDVLFAYAERFDYRA